MDNVKRLIVKNFVVFEGLDGAGTTTQIDGIHRRFLKQKIPALLTCEPTNSPVGRIIRNVLEKNIKVRSDTLALLFAADRNEHLWGKNGMMEHLDQGNFVLCDRYIFSSLAYQTLESSFDFVWELNSRFPLPENLFFVDVPPEECQNRMELRNTKEIFDEIQFQHKIRQAYLDAFRAFKQTGMKTYIIDGTRSADNVEEKIWNILEKETILKT